MTALSPNPNHDTQFFTTLSALEKAGSPVNHSDASERPDTVLQDTGPAKDETCKRQDLQKTDCSLQHVFIKGLCL